MLALCALRAAPVNRLFTGCTAGNAYGRHFRSDGSTLKLQARRGPVFLSFGDDFDPDKNKRERDRMAREASLAWLDEHVRTLDARSLGRGLFLANASSRQRIATAGLETLRDNLAEAAISSAEPDSEDLDEDLVLDGVFLGMHLFAAHSDAWLGPDAWPNSIMLRASVPGSTKEAVAQALGRDISAETVSAKEIMEVVDAFVASTWGEGIAAPSAQEFAGVVISTPPLYAMIHYVIGFLWGYASRGLILRLAFDRTLDTVPETAESARKRLERQFLDAASSNASSITEKPKPTLLQYASEFYGHRDWADLCRPSDAAIAVLEAELEEAMPGLALLAGADDDESPETEIHTVGQNPADWGSLIGLGSSDDDADEGMVSHSDMVMLDQEDWNAFQRRSIIMGALTADAEALVDGEVGPLQRNQRPASKWARRLVKSGVISGVQQEQGGALADRLSTPLRRLTNVLRDSYLPSKLRSARARLSRMFTKDAEDPK